ncbi:class II fructose-bisphosphate aldolase [Lacisediminihabitans profunda]|uniref:Class II fructose-bisphosphate aldolase n=1 Tax=Lacisediminihabitans profunda TaxID=2594790 RepID=A0A5C8ULP3_9MICO|nr:class II fructose-bisphosphate aldolase [Lacisediminihabitans profunda]TXN28721.1 class II fructose-bisphosphate aldolase [Lacisediminihabitans profunda]
MEQTIRRMRENSARARSLMARSRREHFAVGAFNIDNQETLIAVAHAAQKLASPVLVEASDGEVASMGLANIRDLVDNYRDEYGIEMYLNLDHCPTVAGCKRAIDAGYEFIHLDISQADHDASLDEIIEGTREVVVYALFTGAQVESEPHYFAGSSTVHSEDFDYEEIKKTFSTPQTARSFVDATGIDTFAAAVGNLHGRYPAPKILDLELLAGIREAIDCQISLHGGSGTPLHYFEEAARIGVSKVNVNSDLRFAFRTTLERVLAENPSEYSVPRLMPVVCDAVQAVVEEKIVALGSAGKAVR